MKATDPLILPTDVVIAPAASLASELRVRLGASDDDRVITRPRSRARSIVIDAGAAAFLERFRRQTTVIEAVLVHAEATGTDPSALLEAAGPLVMHLFQHKLLAVVGEAGAAPIEAMFGPGSIVAGVEVIRCVHLFEDVEVYRARRGDGGEVALKILRPAAGERGAAALEREVAMLAHIAGQPAPMLLDHGEVDGRAFVVQRWCDGIDIARVAAARRAAAAVPYAPDVLALCADVLRAFAALHERGVVHGDVHPGNIRVDPDGAIWVLDFGLAHRGADDVHLPPPPRGGVHEYLEPECCAAMLRDQPMPRATPRSDQYSLAALLYLLLTGSHCFDFAVERTEWMRQVAAGGPLSLTARGCPPWPALDALFARALDIEPMRRFESVRELLAAFEEITAPLAVPRRPHGRGAELLAAALHRLGDDAATAVAPSRYSINFGAAGVAWFLYRVAGLRDDPRLLSAADVWCTRVLRNPGVESFDRTDVHVGGESTARLSPFHYVSGAHLVRAHICRAMGDLAGANHAAHAFVDACSAPGDNPDLTLGWTSALLGCVALLEALPDADAIDRRPIVALGARLASDVEALLARGPIARTRDPRWLGIAHGWAGLLFGLLRWTQASGAEFPAVARARLDELAALGVREGRQIWWPLRLGDEAYDHNPFTGWCHGSAGYVLLWTLAHRVLRDDRLLALARAAAEHVDACRGGADVNGSLCCGYAGQGFALLALYRATGDPRALRLASELGDRAVQLASTNGYPDSLYKGDVGVALLVEELAHPDRSCMPLVESEGWAPSNA